MRVLRFLLKKEFLQILRDRAMVRLIFAMPLIQLLLLANAATFEVRDARLYVIDRDRSTMSRGLVDRLVASGRFVITEASASMTQANEAMLDRVVDAIVVIPNDFERDLVRQRRSDVQLVLNAEDGVAAGVTQSYAAAMFAQYAAELNVELTPAFARAGSGSSLLTPKGIPQIDVRQRGWYNAELEYRDYMVPGILVVLVTMMGTMLTAMNIVREKEIGTLDQLNVTPVSRPAFIASKLIPIWICALFALSLGLTLGHFVLGVPILGSLWLVFGAAAIYLVCALGIGLWISTVVETQQQAMFVTFFIMMIYLLMSGLFTPVRAMPEWAQWIAEVNPVRHFVAFMRAVLLKGAGFRDVWYEIAILAGMGSAVLAVAVRQYHKRAE